jgi:hypothetical protein
MHQAAHARHPPQETTFIFLKIQVDTFAHIAVINPVEHHLSSCSNSPHDKHTYIAQKSGGYMCNFVDINRAERHLVHVQRALTKNMNISELS